MQTMKETTTKTINEVTAHLHNLNDNGYIICPVNLTATIVNAAIALGCMFAPVHTMSTHGHACYTSINYQQ